MSHSYLLLRFTLKPRCHTPCNCVVQPPPPLPPAHTHIQDHAELAYGPWMDAERGLIMSYFLPRTYIDQEVYVPVAGEWRWHKHIVTKMRFSQPSLLQVPFRELSKALVDPRLLQTPPTGMLTVEFAPDSTMKYDMDMVMPSLQ